MKSTYKVFKHPSLYLISFFFFLVLELLILFAVDYIKETEIENYFEVATPDYQAHVRFANYHLNDLSKIFYDMKINTKRVRYLLYKASKATMQTERSLYRDELYKLLLPTYQYMKKYKVRQLHFHLPEAVSFLRFHRPSKYGDSLIGVRDTLAYVNRYKKPVNVFEEGRIFNGFRNVYPLFYEGEFIGSVEISFSFVAIEELLLKIEKSTYLFMIKKNIIEKKVWGDEQNNYTQSSFENFEYDKKSLVLTSKIPFALIEKINKEIAPKVKERLERGELFSIYIEDFTIGQDKEHSFIVSFDPVYNLHKQVVAYVIHYDDGEVIDIIVKNSSILFIVLSILAFSMSIILFLLLLNERKKQLIEHELALHDALTGIYNRHGVNEVFNQKVQEFFRNRDDFSVIFCDIDHFKKINDTYGHSVGDDVLKELAKIISREIRQSDIVARWGGEEFIIFLPKTSFESALNVAKKLRKTIQKHIFNTYPQNLTCSFGVTTFRVDDTQESFIERVDNLLYQAKERGRNRVEGSA